MDTGDRAIVTDLKGSIATAVACERAYQVYAKPNPLQPDNILQSIAKEGTSLAELVKGLDSSLIEITVNGEVVPCQYWSQLKPKAGTTVNIRSYPQGKTVRKIIAIVIIIVVLYFTQGAGAGYLQGLMGVSATSGTWLAVSMAISFVGMLAVSALVKPTMPKGPSSSSNDGTNDRNNSITGTQNSFIPYGVQPCVIGETRFFPSQCAMPYTEMHGDDQYLRMLLDLGPGDLSVSEIQIGEDDIATFNDVEYQLGPDPQLYTNDIFELSVGANLPNDNTTAPVKTTTAVADEISVEVAWPQGLYGATKEGKDVQVTMGLDIQYRSTTGTTAGQPFGQWVSMSSQAVAISHGAVTKSGSQFVCTSSARKMIRCDFRLKVPQGQYEVQVVRGATNWGSSDSKARIGDFGWITLRSIRYTNPCNLTSTKLAVRIKATDQLNGSISTLNCRVKQNIKFWTGTTWSYGPTNNPAWIYLWLLTACPANPRKMSELRVDLTELKAWAADCTAWGLEYASVADSTTTIFELLQDICAAGKASFTMKNGLYSVVRDVQQSVPVQMFTPRNSWDFTGSRIFSDQVHGLHCTFINQQAGWQKDERIVYQTGYNAGNATNFEKFDMRGMINPDAVWRLASYHLAVSANRQNQYSFKCDFESLICTRGDLILVSHPVCNWGSGWGRVNTVNTDPATIITLDEDIPLVPFKNNVVRIRKDDGTSVISSVKSSNLIYYPTITYTRNSEATYRGFDGNLSYADVNQPRYCYGPAAEELGVLIEESSTNLLPWSELLSDSSWGVTNAALDYTGGVAPDGASLAMRLIATAVNGSHLFGKFVPGTYTTATPITLSVFVKSAGNRYVSLHLANSLAALDQVFDLTAGAVGVSSQTGTQIAKTQAVIEPWNDGWYRISLSANCAFTGSSGSLAANLYIQNGNNFTTFTGTGGNGVLMWGWQCEKKLWASSYIPTNGAAVTRAADAASVPSTPTTGTFVTEFTPIDYVTTGTTYAVPFSLNDGTNSERFHVQFQLDTNQVQWGFVDGNVVQAQVGVSVASGITYRAAASYQTNSFRISVNGSAVALDSVGTTPTVTTLQFGQCNGQFFLNGYLRTLEYHTNIYSDAQLIAASTPGAAIVEDDLVLMSALSGVKEGDLAVVGTQSEESARMVVTKIEPSSNLTATITCVDEAPTVYTAGNGTPPGFVSTVTNQPWCPAPPVPMITGTVTTGFGTGSPNPGGNDNGGTNRPGIQITFRPRVSTSADAPVVGSTTTDTEGTSVGTSVGSAVTSKVAGTSGQAIGTGAAVGASGKKIAGTGSATGVASATGSSASKAAAIGFAQGVAVAIMPSGNLPTGVDGRVTGVATVTGRTSIIAGVNGSTSGADLPTATAVGASGQVQPADGSSTSITTVFGDGANVQIAPGVYDADGIATSTSTASANAACRALATGNVVGAVSITAPSAKIAGTVNVISSAVTVLGASGFLRAGAGSSVGATTITSNTDFATFTRGFNIAPAINDASQWALTGTVAPTIDSAGIHFVGASNIAAALNSSMPTIDGGTYEAIWTVANLSGGGVRILLGGATLNHGDTGATQTANGTYTETLVLTATFSSTNTLRIQATGTSGTNTYDVTAITVRQVLTGGGPASDPPPSGITTTPLNDGPTGAQFTNESGTPLTGDIT